jgi:hypothetical protein
MFARNSGRRHVPSKDGFLKIRALVLSFVAAVAALLTGLVGSEPTYAETELTWPFAIGTSWRVCNGYHQGYALDLVVYDAASPCAGGKGTNNPTQGQNVIAAASGTVVKAAKYKATTAVICVNIDGANFSYLIAHIENRLAPGTVVTKGQSILGTLQKPLPERFLPGNNNISHSHFGLFKGHNCPGTDPDAPFSSADGGLNIDGASYPGSANSGQYTGIEVRRSGATSPGLVVTCPDRVRVRQVFTCQTQVTGTVDLTGAGYMDGILVDVTGWPSQSWRFYYTTPGVRTLHFIACTTQSGPCTEVYRSITVVGR